ncbi:MAG: holo-ACP synthase [Candidatus Methylopumilus sp.]
MIFGIGTDVVEVSRIHDSIEKFGDTFARRILSDSEFEGYLVSSIQSRFLAKRFAAKEAFAKALGTGFRSPVRFQNIIVGHDDLGKPILVFNEALKSYLKEKKILSQHISISDEKNIATAFVILEI